jgi:hypothetical protein
MTAPVDDLMRQAIKARQRAQTAVGAAVREAQAAGWSWDRMSAALGGSPTAETLQRTFTMTSGATTSGGEPSQGGCACCAEGACGDARRPCG